MHKKIYWLKDKMKAKILALAISLMVLFSYSSLTDLKEFKEKMNRRVKKLAAAYKS